MGFAYLMMRRYMDAIKTFCNILLYIARTKQYHTRSCQYEMARLFITITRASFSDGLRRY
jgi:hypothetical protein